MAIQEPKFEADTSAGDYPDGGVLLGIDKYLAQLDQQTQAAATQDQKAAEAGAPGPPMVDPSSGIDFSGVQDPSGAMDFSGGAAPAAAPQPVPQPDQPPQQLETTPMQQPAPMGAPGVDPQQMADYSHAQTQQALTAADQNRQLQEKGTTEAHQAQMEMNPEMQAAAAEKLKTDRETAAGIKEIDDALKVKQAANEAALQTQIDEQKKLLDYDPRAWWQHATTIQRIGAVIGIIGSGLGSGRSQSFIDHLVDQDAATYDRKLRISEGIGRSLSEQNRIQSGNADDRMKLLDKRKITAYESIAQQLEVAKSKTANLATQANFDKEIADIRTKAADIRNKILNGEMTHAVGLVQAQLGTSRLQQGQAAIEQRRKDNERDYGQRERFHADTEGDRAADRALRAANADRKDKEPKPGNRFLELPEHPGTYIDPKLWTGDVVKKYNSYGNVLNASRELRRAFEIINDKNILEGSDEKNKANSMMSSAARDLSGAGANLTGDEKKDGIDPWKVTWGKYLIGEANGFDVLKALDNTDGMIARSTTALLKRVSSREFTNKPDSPIGEINAREEKDSSAKAEVESVLNDTRRSPIAKRAALRVLANKGNKFAAEAVSRIKE